MRIEVAQVGGVVVMTVRGEIDFASADALGAALDGVPRVEHIVLDLSAVEFMDSSGLAVVLRQAMRRRDAGGTLQIRQPSQSVRRLLVFCCLEHLLEPERPAERLKRRGLARRPRA
jgi:anti-anti-sigma factor